MTTTLHIIKGMVFLLVFTGFVQAKETPSEQNQQISKTIENITYYSENYPPSSYYENGEVTGISVETLRLIWDHFGVVHPKIHLAPWLRSYRTALSTPNTMVFGTSRTAERDPLFKWVGPLFASNRIIIARSDFSDEVRSIRDLLPYTIAVNRQAVTHTQLKQAGHPKNKIEEVTVLKQAMLMLASNRVDMVILSKGAFNRLLKQAELPPENFKVILNLEAPSSYFAFNIDTPSWVINKYQTAFDSLLPERIELMKKYDLFISDFMTPEMKKYTENTDIFNPPATSQ
jgi:polar amino acid transport system substrate-binding protein